ncbi:hypothetical protein L226DRAFT_529022 [Lentinus tigrinus ALCF2SS1-7]|uniref:uncharacterized protein n=1 Tax=Lentinus tigrinus ALCF2SS1-7 TaxID=1328758 RepID=UPI0011660611|nr:hypothetical protein L226DRAFT_529022 [Lentinus tigrinus ALCF2SS1-7]
MCVLVTVQTSPYVLRTRLAFEEAGATYYPLYFKMDESQKPSADSVLLYESLVILEFIVDFFPDAGLLPADLVRRAKARLFMSIVEEKIPSDNGPTMLETLQEMLPEGFVVGEWSIADAAFVPSLLFVNVFVKGGVGYWVKMEHGEKVKAELESPRLARLRRYVDEWKKRTNFNGKAAWDEAHCAASCQEDIVIEKWLKRFAKNL